MLNLVKGQAKKREFNSSSLKRGRMASDAEINPLKPRPRRRRGKPLQDQRFSSYLTFGFQVTACLGVFLAIYVLVLISLTPLLSEETPNELKRGEALKPVMDPILAHLKRIPQEPMQGLAEGVAEAMKKQFAESRQKLGLSDSSLIEKASAEVNHLRKNRGVVDDQASLKAKEELALHNVEPPAGVHGVIVLGMHRSGTSMLSGLMVTGSGYNTGGPLIGSAFDNEKGFFERLVSKLTVFHIHFVLIETLKTSFLLFLSRMLYCKMMNS